MGKGYTRLPGTIDAPTQVSYVRQASDLAGVLSSDITYIIDGQVDMGNVQVTVPAGGLYLSGYNFDNSGLFSTEDNYTMFSSGTAGNLIWNDFYLSTSGANSQLFDLTSNTGLDAFELTRLNFNDCTSLGTITNYRQGLESGTGRFGGSPTLTLAGTWVGGYFIDTSIVRSLDAGMTTALYAAGVGFTMASRFRSNQNIDLPANASFVDFAPSNFPNPSTLQLQGAIITRNGASNAEDPNITPNITQADLASDWSNNQGMLNTYVGGRWNNTAEAATVISVVGQFETLAGTFTGTGLQHFDSPVNGQLRHLGNNPRDFTAYYSLSVEGPSNNAVSIRLMRYDSSAAQAIVVDTQTRQINALVGSRDIAFFNVLSELVLDQNDYVYLEIANLSGTGNLTIELNSYLTVSER